MKQQQESFCAGLVVAIMFVVLLHVVVMSVKCAPLALQAFSTPTAEPVVEISPTVVPREPVEVALLTEI